MVNLNCLETIKQNLLEDIEGWHAEIVFKKNGNVTKN
jgi:hypothetical protein